MKKKNLNESAEVGNKADAQMTDVIGAKPYVEIMAHVANDYGKDSNLYWGMKEIFEDPNFDYNKLIELLYEYGVYDKYKHLLGMNETTIEAPAKDIKTLKSTNAVGPKDTIRVVPDNQKQPYGSSTNTSTTTSSSSQMYEDGNVPSDSENLNANDDNVEAVIEPQDKETIKYLSNVKDANTGEVSKPFVIGGKNYQMIRGIKPNREIVMAVYCLDDMDSEGNNIIHPMEYFEENIAKKHMNEGGYDYAAAENEFHDKEAFMDYLNLADVAGYKHFFVNIKNGKVIAKFKNTKDMVKSGVKLGPDEDYMDAKTLKRFRFGEYFKKNVSEEETPADNKDTTNINKLQSDVKKLTNMIKAKFSMYLSKLDKPIEQAQFLTAMAQEIGVPLNKLSTIINSYKDIATPVNATQPQPVAESKVITKNDLESGINESKVIKTIKVKELK